MASTCSPVKEATPTHRRRGLLRPIDPGPGNDFVNGGLSRMTGQRRLIYLDAANGIQADLGAGTTTGEGSDEIVNIEWLIGSSHDDVVIGSALPFEVIFGAAGDDVIHALGGEDAMAGGAGDDLIDGGEGLDSSPARSSPTSTGSHR